AHQGLSKRDMASDLNSRQFYIEKVKRHSFYSKLCGAPKQSFTPTYWSPHPDGQLSLLVPDLYLLPRCLRCLDTVQKAMNHLFLAFSSNIFDSSLVFFRRLLEFRVLLPAAPGNGHGGGLCAGLRWFVPGLWERDLFLSDRASSMDRVPLWTRYIDDVFLIWQGSVTLLEEFMGSLNRNDCNIKLTYHSDSKTVEFLDVLVKRDSGDMIQTDIYRKPTSTNTLLHASSAHPGHVIQAVSTGFLSLNDMDYKAKEKSWLTQIEQGSFFLQLQGTAMGAAFAPAYAGLFLGLWERDLFLSDRASSIDRVPLWTRKTVEFLDVLVKRDSGDMIQTDIYRKPTSTNTLLHASSAHPGHVIQAVPTGQFLRLRRGLMDISSLNTIPKHFYLHHNSDASLFRVRGIDSLDSNIRGGNMSKKLAQLESRWIWSLNTLHPNGLNEQINFAPFL
ncbi:unnamed protein product, partial [Ranitomeya imitator]